MLKVTHLNPDALPRSPVFSQAVSVAGPARTIYVGGQNAVAADGSVIGEDAGAQTARALENLGIVLAESGARLEDVVYWSISVVAGQPPGAPLWGFHTGWGNPPNP